jgi:hypothetical protein
MKAWCRINTAVDTELSIRSAYPSARPALARVLRRLAREGESLQARLVGQRGRPGWRPSSWATIRAYCSRRVGVGLGEARVNHRRDDGPVARLGRAARTSRSVERGRQAVSERPSAVNLLDQGTGLLNRTDLCELELERGRSMPSSGRCRPRTCRGHARPLIRVEDYLALIAEHTYGGPTSVRPACGARLPCLRSERAPARGVSEIAAGGDLRAGQRRRADKSPGNLPCSPHRPLSASRAGRWAAT